MFCPKLRHNKEAGDMVSTLKTSHLVYLVRKQTTKKPMEKVQAKQYQRCCYDTFILYVSLKNILMPNRIQYNFMNPITEETQVKKKLKWRKRCSQCNSQKV